MSNVLVFGDGGIAEAIAQQIKDAGHNVAYDQHLYGYSSDYLEIAENDEDFVVLAYAADEASAGSTMLERVNSNSYPWEKPIFACTLATTVTQVGLWLDFRAKIARSRPIPPKATNIVGWAALPPLADTKVIEVLPGLKSDPAMVEKACEFWRSLGKEPVIVKDSVGGVLPRVVASLINNAAYALMEGVASAEDIDLGMKLGTNYPRGPLEWADLIGLDQVLGILNALHDVHGERYRPAPLLRQLVDAGYWGRRTGRGFYEYGDGKPSG